VRIYFLDDKFRRIDRDALREEIGSIAEAAAALGISRQAVANYLSGAACPRTERAEKMWQIYPRAFRVVNFR
jgi:predicted transcriptional regulator